MSDTGNPFPWSGISSRRSKWSGIDDKNVKRNVKRGAGRTRKNRGVFLEEAELTLGPGGGSWSVFATEPPRWTPNSQGARDNGCLHVLRAGSPGKRTFRAESLCP